MTLPRIVAIVGPTAAGKSRLALSVAERFELPILCCDSVQVYRGLDLGSAKPTAEDRRRVRHEMLDLVEPDVGFSAADYAARAWTHLDRSTVVVCGGTGFYLRALAWTLSAADQAEPPGREEFDRDWTDRDREHPGSAHRALDALDPPTAQAIHPRNLVRTLRALWLCQAHGRPLSQMRADDPPRPRVQMCVIVLDPGQEEIDRAIARRRDAMIGAGWIDEVEMLLRRGYHARTPAMRSLGYRQLVDHIEGRLSRGDALASIRTATRQYARRQRTYFRHQLPSELRLEISSVDALDLRRVEAFLT